MLKEDKQWIFIDIQFPADQNIVKTQNEEAERYQELAFEVKITHQASKASAIAIVVVVLGTISRDATTSWQKSEGFLTSSEVYDSWPYLEQCVC